MKLERNAYEDDFPLNINIMSVDSYPAHYHKDTEIIYVLKGELQFRNGPFDYLLQAGDVFTNNTCEVHSMQATEKENVIASIKISSNFFTRFFPHLTKSTYMFYTKADPVPQQEHLKYLLLSLIDKSLKQGYNYKQQCIDETLRIIEYLENHFNVFGFGEDQLTKFENQKPAVIKRLHDIIHYTYENHSANISLSDLAEMEHLNKYYLSHLIKDSIGISYAEFLYFVRVEWSEVRLLNPKFKISEIAHDVGFSSTACYRKYFIKWFGCTPEEYRLERAPKIKSDKNPEIVRKLTTADAISIVKPMMSSAESFSIYKGYVNSKNIDINIEENAPTLKELYHDIKLILTLEDYQTLHTEIFKYLNELKCSHVEIACEPFDNAIEITSFRDELISAGYNVILKNAHTSSTITPSLYGYDSIAYALFLLKEHLTDDGEAPFPVQLRDQGNTATILKGLPSLLTSNEIPKPSYYAYFILSLARGDLLSYGDHYAVIRLHQSLSTYLILTYNYDDSILRLSQKKATPYEVLSTISSYHDELEISVNLSLPEGKYFISKYSFDYYNNIFNFMGKLNFPSAMPITNRTMFSYCTTPQTDVYSTDLTETPKLNSFFNGVGMQATLVQKL